MNDKPILMTQAEYARHRGKSPRYIHKLAKAAALAGVADTIRGFQEIVDGKHDGIPEQAFYMKGGIEKVLPRRTSSNSRSRRRTGCSSASR